MALFSPPHGNRSRGSQVCLAAAALICLAACGGGGSETMLKSASRDASFMRWEAGGNIAIKLDAATAFQPSPDGGVAGSAVVDGGLPPPTPLDAGCTVGTATLRPRPPEVLLVLDRSTTMAEAISADGTSKWGATVAAIESAVLASQDATAWGMMLFPKPTDDTACCQMPENDLSPVAEVAPAQRSTLSISATLAQSTPSGTGAPTARALIQAANYLVARWTSTSKYIVLATAAEPTCASDGLCSGAATADYARTKETIAHVASVLGIPVAVAGIGLPSTSNVSQPNGRLQVFADLANLGGMANTTKGQAAYYAADSTPELVAALATLSSQMTSCSFALPGPVAWQDNVVVLLSDNRIARDTSHQDGWNFADRGTSVVLFGKPCNDARKLGSRAALSFTTACPALAIN